MKKTITVYELLGLIKEGKAPEKAIYDDYVYSFNEENRDYYNINLDEYLIYRINGDGDNWLDVEIEIFEEKENNNNFTGLKMYADGKEFMSIDYSDKEEFEDIEEITQDCFDDWTEAKAINKLIRNQKKIIERLKKNGN